MSNKPVVTFGRVIGWNDDGKVEKGTRALLGEVENHPRLGAERMVNTSMVINIKRERKTKRVIEIETLNTIYRIKE
jgi:hypothetical protein